MIQFKHKDLKKIVKEKRRGFTLIEILIVIGIIGILASVIVTPLNNSKKKARDARRISELKQLQLALEVYAASNQNMYPDTLEGLGVTIPIDPLTGDNYFYCANGTGAAINNATSFHLGAILERVPHVALESDADILEDGCEGLSGNPSFSGVATDCTGLAGCQGANCENCYDLGPAENLDSDTSEDNSSEENPGSEELSVPTGLGVDNLTSHYADLIWSGSGASGYVVSLSGYLFDSEASTWKNMTKEFITTNNYQYVSGLYIHHTYSFVVEAFDSEGNLSGESASFSFFVKEFCPDGSCSDHEFCFSCPQDCGSCPQPIEYYESNPFFSQYFPIDEFECPFE